MSAYGIPTSQWQVQPLSAFQQAPMLGASTRGTAISFVNAVYYPNWRVYRQHPQQPPSSLNTGFISHIFYAFAWPSTDGNIALSDDFADTEIEVDGTEGCIRALVNLKQRNPLLKIILSIGGGGMGSANFARVAANPTKRHIFSRSAADLVRQYDFDGVDIDWEHPSNGQEGDNYILLLAATRSLLPAPNYILTTALPAGEWALQHINIGLASTYVDFVNLMGYDFSGQWSNLSGHQAQLYSPLQPHNEAVPLSCHSAVAYIAQRGVPLPKILLGIPTFGRSFLNATGIGQTYEGVGGEEGTFDYRDLPRPGTQEFIDMNLGAAFSVGGDGGFVSYDNPRTVQMKANYVREARLGGLFYWTGTGDAQGTRSLVRTGYNTLHNL